MSPPKLGPEPGWRDLDQFNDEPEGDLVSANMNCQRLPINRSLLTKQHAHKQPIFAKAFSASYNGYMFAAKEKTFSPSSRSTFTWSPRGTYVQAAATHDRQPSTMNDVQPVVSRFTQNDFRARKSQKSPIGSTVKSRPKTTWQNQHSTEKTLGENVVQLRRSHWTNDMSQYRAYFVPGAVDPFGTICQAPKDTCGPDATSAFVQAVAQASLTLNNLPPLKERRLTTDPLGWGTSIDFTFKAKTAASNIGCSTGKCKNSVTFCGKCVHTHTLNNILYGIVGTANGLPLHALLGGGAFHESAKKMWPTLEGLPQRTAYWVGWNIDSTIVDHPGHVHINKTNICKRVKQAGQINNFVGFEKCKPCGKTADLGDFKWSIGDPLPPMFRK